MIAEYGRSLDAHLKRTRGQEQGLNQFYQSLSQTIAAQEALDTVIEPAASSYLKSSTVVTSQVLTACTGKTGSILAGDVRSKLHGFGVCQSDGMISTDQSCKLLRFFSVALPKMEARRNVSVSDSFDIKNLLTQCLGKIDPAIVKPKTNRAFLTDLFLTLNLLKEVEVVPTMYPFQSDASARAFLTLWKRGTSSFVHIEVCVDLSPAEHTNLIQDLAANPLLAGIPVHCLNFLCNEGVGVYPAGAVDVDSSHACTWRQDT